MSEQHHYTLYIDEAGDDRLGDLKPRFAQGNSEWLCLGGYLIQAGDEAKMDLRRDAIRCAIGGQAGQALHFRDLHPKNRMIAARLLASLHWPVRGFIVCSYKQTMKGYRNPRAEAVQGAPPRDMLYNYLCRLLLERVTHFVARHGRERGIAQPLLRIVMASRRGHHFGSFKTFLTDKLVAQAIGGTTFQDIRVIEPSVIRRSLVERQPASQLAGLQLADVMVSAFFQSIEQASPHYAQKPALALRPLMAQRPLRYAPRRSTHQHEGVTLYHPNAARLLTAEQAELFEAFGYKIPQMARRDPMQRPAFTQKERLFSNQMPD